MNWENVPYLFANGKFMVRWQNKDYKCLGSREQRYYLRDGSTYSKISSVPFSMCTLIARRIKDMTDEEINQILKDGPDCSIEEFAEVANKGMTWASDLVYLLSIGVYPFDQSHFETGEVIDRRTLCNSQD